MAHSRLASLRRNQQSAITTCNRGSSQLRPGRPTCSIKQRSREGRAAGAQTTYWKMTLRRIGIGQGAPKIGSIESDSPEHPSSNLHMLDGQLVPNSGQTSAGLGRW